MCLSLRFNSEKPYNKHFTRYKVVYHSPRGNGGKFIPKNRQYYGPYRSLFYYKPDTWNKAELNGSKTDEGFHVFVDKRDARLYARELFGYVKTVAVRGFLRSGTFGSTKSETWKEMIFLD